MNRVILAGRLLEDMVYWEDDDLGTGVVEINMGYSPESKSMKTQEIPFVLVSPSGQQLELAVADEPVIIEGIVTWIPESGVQIEVHRGGFRFMTQGRGV